MLEETQRGCNTTGLRRCFRQRKIKHLESCCNISVGREEYSIIQFFLFLLFFCQKFPFSGKLYVHCQSKLTVLSIFCEKLFIRNFQGKLFLLSFREHILQIQLFISRGPDDMSALNFSLCLTMKSSFPPKTSNFIVVGIYWSFQVLKQLSLAFSSTFHAFFNLLSLSWIKIWSK